MGDEALKIVGDGQPFEIAGEKQDCRLPPEREHQADDEGPLETGTDQGEYGAVRDQPRRQHAEIGQQRRELGSNRATAHRHDEEEDEDHRRQHEQDRAGDVGDILSE